jgi:hypothetical protein
MMINLARVLSIYIIHSDIARRTVRSSAVCFALRVVWSCVCVCVCVCVVVIVLLDCFL